MESTNYLMPLAKAWVSKLWYPVTIGCVPCYTHLSQTAQLAHMVKSGMLKQRCLYKVQPAHED